MLTFHSQAGRKSSSGFTTKLLKSFWFSAGTLCSPFPVVPISPPSIVVILKMFRQGSWGDPSPVMGKQ